MKLFSPFDFDTRRAIQWGSVWALAVAACEALAMSPERWASVQLLLWWLVYWLVPLWALTGALLLWLLNRGERQAGAWGLVIAFLLPIPLPLLGQPFGSALMMHASQRIFPALDEFAAASAKPVRDQLLDLGVYNLWLYFFYGSMLTAVFMLTVRSERIRSRLHATAMSRSRTEVLLDTERLQALQAQIDPKLLLESMRELEQRYRNDPDRAERLFDALVEFLRDAMNGLRVPVSTLDAELRLAHAFANLQRERGVLGYWRFADDDLKAAEACKFPSLLMLRLLALGDVQGRPLLRVREEPSRTVLQLFGLGDTMTPDLQQQVHARLRMLHGSGFNLQYLPSRPTQLAIVFNHGITT